MKLPSLFWFLVMIFCVDFGLSVDEKTNAKNGSEIVKEVDHKAANLSLGNIQTGHTYLYDNIQHRIKSSAGIMPNFQ